MMAGEGRVPGCGRVGVSGGSGCGDGCFDVVSVAWVAGGPALFVGGEVGEEAEALADGAFPGFDVDGLGEHADRVGLEVLFAFGGEDVGGVEWLGSAVVVDDVGPHFEDPDAPEELLVADGAGELGEVVDVAAERGASVAGEFLGAGFGFGDDRQCCWLERVGGVDRERDDG